MTASPGALLLARRDVRRLMASADWLEAVETGFGAAAAGRAATPPPMHIAGSGGAFHAKGASLDVERRYVALKLNGNFPGNPGRALPTIQGVVLLCDGETGALLAIMDSIEVTLRRTAAASALAARFLARPDSATILVGGCGEQGRAQLAALCDILPLRRARLWDRERDRAEALAAETCARGLDAEAVEDLPSAARDSDVIAACTTASRPWLDAAMVAPGTFVAAVGADAPDKSEVAPALMASAMVVTDLTDQCAAMGDLRHAIAAGAMDKGDVHAELAELVDGSKPGRVDDEQVTLFDSTGTALQDVAAAAMIYRRAIDRGVGRQVELAM